ncbi:MAG: AAA family ATPase, partial [Myxococcales bacterium]|nr:AAA family ATPase [Myxococcales bacterium]
MSTASTLHELTTLVRSYHSLIVIDSAEEERARHLVGAAANSLGISCFEWSVAQGLQFASSRETGGRGIANTHEASGVLRHLLTLQAEGVFLLKDFAPHLDDPVVRRLLREVCQAFNRTRSAVIVTGTAIALSPELESHAAYLSLELPTTEELHRTVAKLGESLLQHSDVRF